ncbi:aliphatic sulfonate ABC transporter substrate-binding protein [Streptomyces sp. HB132]|uniref:aliphatic sulfonate ABC transporter substrate-binding protein n=1 Tax=Streptomyces sp. HB132 TaxID=767388 RepID=UPI00195FAC65|nr:aliphatic sulfonate ABC transporter substrate-binding protein [Streptomyces sp. HB132]MBM7442462.1 NitT/TauT family transport system substrate-binding protein [Streptomyces sp. HB132]
MRLPQRALTAAVTVSALALSVSGCSGDPSSDGASTVRFGYISDYNGASLLAIADQQGLWKEEGLDPEYSTFTNGPLQIQALGSGNLDFGYIGPGAMWLPASGKAKVVAVNTLARADRVIAQPGITSIKDLEGKKVGVPEGTSGAMALDLALRKAGMSDEDIEKVPMDPSTVVSAFVSGQIDGAGLWYPLIDNIKAKKPDLNEVASTADFKDRAFPTAFVAPAKSDAKLNTKVVKVLQRANDWRAAHPDEAIDAAASLLEVDRAKVAADAANVETLSTADLVARTEDGTVAGWLDGLGEFFVDTGQLKKAPAAGTYYEGDLYTKAYKK